MEELVVSIEQYTKITRDIEVTVIPEFIEAESNIPEGVYAYAYSVMIRNLGPRTVQLMNRHWIVLSANRQIADVKGEGVIGEQPILKSGDSYQYTSWTVVKDPFGAMFGAYTFYSETGEFFDVEIPRFNLIYVDSSSIH